MIRNTVRTVESLGSQWRFLLPAVDEREDHAKGEDDGGGLVHGYSLEGTGAVWWREWKSPDLTGVARRGQVSERPAHPVVPWSSTAADDPRDPG